jgi:hypothetical protein
MQIDLKDGCAIAAEWVKIVGGLIAFAVGLRQYTLAQRWKRREFIAEQIKNFETNEKIHAALTMLDWTGRPILLRSNKTGQVAPRLVDEQLLTTALLPRSPAQGFTDTQASIRDCFDGLLDVLVRLQTFLKSELISQEELEPYIDYWIKKIVGKPNPQHEKRFYILLHQYIDVYGFAKARTLIESYGYDISWPPHEVKKALDQTLAESERCRQSTIEQ